MSKFDLWKAAKLWNESRNTQEIARELLCLESEVYNRIGKIKETAKKL